MGIMQERSQTMPGTEIELEEMNIILRIPKEAVALEVTASILDENGELMRVKNSHTVSNIREQRQAFLENVEGGDDYDALYVLTDEGREYLERLRNGGVCG